jgi:glycosyltransferase involved in cell wall biosynthesis
MANVHQVVRDHQLKDQVEFLGNQESVACILPRCDLSLLNSEHESFGLAILEAMACGVPAVTSNVGGLPEVIEHGVSGYLCNRQDLSCMAKYALDILSDEHHERFSVAAQQRSCQHFSIDHIGPQYESLYRNIL